MATLYGVDHILSVDTVIPEWDPPGINSPGNTKVYLSMVVVFEHETHEECPYCSYTLKQPISFKSAPNVLVFEINSKNIKISRSLKFVQDSETVVLDVRELIYHGDFHFTSHINGNDNKVWYHDGMTSGSTCENEGDFDSFSTKKLSKCKGKRLLLVVYVRGVGDQRSGLYAPFWGLLHVL